MPSVLCALVEDCRPFVVDFDLDWIVERLKEAIKAKRRRALGGFDECDFTLYKGELDQSVKMAREIKLLSENLHTCTELENPNRALSTIFQNPPTGHEHIVLVRTPQGLPEVPSIQYLHPGVSIDTTLRFISTQPRVFDEDLLRNNDITKESNPPSQISLIRENLEKPRPVTKQQQEFVNFNTIIAQHVEIREAGCSNEEVGFYLALFFSRSETSNLGTTVKKQGGGAAYLEYIASYLCNAYSTPNEFSSEGRWPISFIGEVEGTRYSYTPRSDFLFLLNKFPFLFFEICSDRNRELDRYRMLLQAGLLVRVVNSIAVKNSESEQTFKSFVAVAIYIDAEFTAERYLVYQPDTVQPQGEPKSIHYVCDKFPLPIPSFAFQFFYQLHNLPDALPAQYKDVYSHLESLTRKVRNENLKGYTARTQNTGRGNKKRKLEESGSGGLSGNHPIDTPPTVPRLLGAGYDREEEDPESGRV